MTECNGPSVIVPNGWRQDKKLRRETIGRRNGKAKGHSEADGMETERHSEADGMETEGIIYADGTNQRLLVNHVCMYKWMTCPPRFGKPKSDSYMKMIPQNSPKGDSYKEKSSTPRKRGQALLL